MKGPMTTQTLRGMVERRRDALARRPLHRRLRHRHEQRHRRSTPTCRSATSSSRSPGCSAARRSSPAADMQKFTDFALQITLPPNPVRALDNSLTRRSSAARLLLRLRRAGQHDHAAARASTDVRCSTEGTARRLPSSRARLHLRRLPHTRCRATASSAPTAAASFEDETQIVKIPHLRNAYTKVGMFGMPDVPSSTPATTATRATRSAASASCTTAASTRCSASCNGKVFDCTNGGLVGFTAATTQRRDVEQFMLAFDTDLAPIVGQQVTMTNTSRNDTNVNDARDAAGDRCRANYASFVTRDPARRSAISWRRWSVGGVGQHLPADPDRALRRASTTRTRRARGARRPTCATARTRPVSRSRGRRCPTGRAPASRPTSSRIEGSRPRRFLAWVRRGPPFRDRPGDRGVPSHTLAARAPSQCWRSHSAAVGRQRAIPPSRRRTSASATRWARASATTCARAATRSTARSCCAASRRARGRAPRSDERARDRVAEGGQDRQSRNAGTAEEAAVAAERGGPAFLRATARARASSSYRAGSSTRCFTRARSRAPDVEDLVICHYRATLLDGTVFDETSPSAAAHLPVTSVIDGFEEALLRMPTGSR